VIMDTAAWNATIARLPRPHLLQTGQWARAKEPFGWTAHYKTWEQDGQLVAAAQILQRSVRLPLIGREVCMLYVPKGPLLADWNDTPLRARVLADLRQFAQELGAFFIKIDPDLAYGYGLPGAEDERVVPAAADFVAELKAAGWRYSNEQVQMPNTMLIDIDKSEEAILAAMKQKGRYNLRLSQKKGVTVRRGTPADFPSFYKMYAETSVRDGFVIRSEAYYRAVWDAFYEAGMLAPLLAEVEGEAVAGLMLFIYGEQSWYLYGMSRALHRETMPNYLLQWEAIRASREAGCKVYDLWGAPDEFNEADPMWGVYRFKDGFGGTVIRHIGAWDYVPNAALYALYERLMPRVLGAMKRRRN